MNRTLSFLAALIAVTAGVGGGLAWLEKHAGLPALGLVATTMFAILVGALVVLVDEWSLRRLFALFAACVPGSILSGYLAFQFERAGSVAIYAYVGAITALIFGVMQLQDRRKHKPCPDCCEIVKKMARVCRHCGYEFWQLDSEHPL